MSRFPIALTTLLLASASFDLSVASAAPRGVQSRSYLQATKTTPDPDAADNPAVRAHYAGVIEGIVAAVDYRLGTISVQMPSRRLDVIVLPSTTIQGTSNAFHTIADIAKGQRVEVFMSQRGNSFIAEIIHLR